MMQRVRQGGTSLNAPALGLNGRHPQTKGNASVRQPEMKSDIFLPVLCGLIIGAVLLTAPNRPRVRDLEPMLQPQIDYFPNKFVNDRAIKKCGKYYCWTPRQNSGRLMP
jgi:hypothetical protein